VDVAPSNQQLKACSNEDLAVLCARRPVEEDAWREFWRRFYHFVYRKVSKLLKPLGQRVDQSGVDDIVQLVFVRIFNGLSGYDRQKSPLTAYLSVITTRTVIEQLRRRKAQRLVPLEELDLAAERIKTGQIEADELWELVIGILARMGPRKGAIVRAFLEGQGNAAIRQRYGVSASYIYTTVYRFRRAMANALGIKNPGVSESEPQSRT